MLRSLWFYHLSLALLLALMCNTLSGCTEKQVAELTTALDDLLRNKVIAEQIVREVKNVCSVSDDDARCEQARSLYEDARGLNDQFIGLIAAGAKPSVVRSVKGAQASTVREAAVEFLAQGSIIIQPGLNTRSVPLERAIIIPDGLPEAARKVGASTRVLMARSYEQQARWTAWDAIPASDNTTKVHKELP